MFLLDFCFKNLDFSAMQLAHIDDCLTTLFVIITFLFVCMFFTTSSLHVL